MMNQELFDYLGLKEGDPAEVAIEIPDFINMDYYMKVFAMLTHKLDFQFDL
jgi:type II secretory pathway component PulC